MNLALEILALVAGGVALLVLLPATPRRERPGSRAVPIQRPADLVALERVTVTHATAGDVHMRLRPVLREIALSRARRHGIQLDRSPDAARELLGATLWELVRAERPQPEQVIAPALSLGELEAIVAQLERL